MVGKLQQTSNNAGVLYNCTLFIHSSVKLSYGGNLPNLPGCRVQVRVAYFAERFS
jgi:hypothetical protein